VVDNKPGAGGHHRIDAVAKSPPDGYTLLMTTSGTVWQNRVLYTKLPYNLDKDLAPVAMFPSGPLVVGVPEKLGINNYRELMAWAKANNTNMGSYAPGSYPHMVADQINRKEGTKLLTVNYKGESPMWIDVASGQLHIAIGSFQAFNTVSTRGVKAIGVTGSYRHPSCREVPTLVEQGVHDALVQARRWPASDGTGRHARGGAELPVAGGGRRRRGARAAQIRETSASPTSPRTWPARGRLGARSAGVDQAGGGPGHQARLSPAQAARPNPSATASASPRQAPSSRSDSKRTTPRRPRSQRRTMQTSRSSSR
jgi:hypothetical protein